MKRVFFLAFSILMVISASAMNDPYSIIPLPQDVKVADCTLAFSSCNIKCQDLSKEEKVLVAEFAAHLSEISGVRAGSSSPILSVNKDDSCNKEAYRLEVKANGVNLYASDYNGFLYGLQTLKQLLPEEIYGDKPAPEADWTLAGCSITDAPFFGYRGAHLDCARHFFPIEEVKKYLDVMAMCKMNRFHWHLTDDQGWRVQIDAYPLLTEVGAWRSGTQIGFDRETCDGIRHGGYYTKDQLREVVAYAKKLGIEIIPEIDLPGHMVAALASYPSLGCTGGPYKVRTAWGISEEVLCAGKESTFEFLEAVLGEVADIFPYEMFHIGGDECPKKAWKACPLCQAKIVELGLKDDEKATKEDYLQSYVMNRIQKFLAGKGKRVIGWDELLTGNPGPGTTIMHWRRTKDCTEAAKRGFDVVLVPNNYFYLDYAQILDPKCTPPAISKNNPERAVLFSKTYSFEPFKGLDAASKKHVVGIQCNLWGEFIALTAHLEYMAMPRMFAVSELQWRSPDSQKDLERLKFSVTGHGFKMLDNYGFVHCMTIE